MSDPHTLLKKEEITEATPRFSQTDSRSSKHIQFRYGIALCVLGLIFLGGLAMMMVDSFATYSWPSVEGRVIDNGVSKSSGMRQLWMDYWVSYEFQPPHSSEPIQSDRVYRHSFDSWPIFLTRQRGREFLKKHYPVGSNVLVFFDPDDHASSVLMQGMQPFDFGYLVLLLLFIGIWITGITQIVRSCRRT